MLSCPLTRISGSTTFRSSDVKGVCQYLSKAGEYWTFYLSVNSFESFDDFPGLGARVTTLFDEKDGMTTMTVTVLAASTGDPRCAAGERDGARRGRDLSSAGGFGRGTI
jgi:hypothetical protein